MRAMISLLLAGWCLSAPAAERGLQIRHLHRACFAQRHESSDKVLEGLRVSSALPCGVGWMLPFLAYWR